MEAGTGRFFADNRIKETSRTQENTIQIGTMAT